MIEQLKRENIDEFNRLSARYFELYPNEEKSKRVFSACVTISYALQDISSLYVRYLNKKFSVDSFYHIMVKVDIVRETYRQILKIFNFKESEIFGNESTKEREVINYFTAIRSIAIAHPQNTDRHSQFGFDGSRYLEDVRKKSDSFLRFTSSENDMFENADFILCLVRINNENDSSYSTDEYKGINLEQNVFEVVKIIENSFEILNNRLKIEMEKKIEDLRRTPIKISELLSETDFKILLEETKKRYPSLIESYTDKDYVYWPLSNIRELMSFISEEWPSKKHELLLNEIVEDYHKKLQNMNLTTTYDDGEELLCSLQERIDSILYPTFKILEKEVNKDFHYNKEKIYTYLPKSTSTSYPEIKSANDSNSRWGLLKMLEVIEYIPEINLIYSNNTQKEYTDKELYFQFIINLFNYNEKHIKDI
ncbi:hypothetical protein [Enterococcus sp. AZ102]|uniref:hypothetical protein n=1 Tax=Enterococcus sp. AZ102 TaxID=2774865 RepID=UPI003F25F675